MRGFPENAHAINVTRPLSRRCAIVSTPLPVRSRYATRLGPNTRSVSYPFGERFTWPSAPAGAVATKNTGCSRHHCARSGLSDAKRSATVSLWQRNDRLGALARVVARPDERTRLDVRESE